VTTVDYALGDVIHVQSIVTKSNSKFSKPAKLSSSSSNKGANSAIEQCRTAAISRGLSRGTTRTGEGGSSHGLGDESPPVGSGDKTLEKVWEVGWLGSLVVRALDLRLGTSLL